MYDIALLSQDKRDELFTATANKKNITKSIVEKDFWVVWTIAKIFEDESLNKILKFKGGTSLSKVFKLIDRFSEDIDLILDWTTVTELNPLDNRSKNQQDKFNKSINESAKEYIKDIILPKVSSLLVPTCGCQIDKADGFSINIKYPTAFKDNYLRPEILLEIGPLASWLPSDVFKISSMVAEEYPDIFKKEKCAVDTIVAPRTFWEKATILHHEANRPDDIPMPTRYSRHYYDLSLMAQSKFKDIALADTKLLENVVEFKQKFYPRKWARYEDAKAGTLKLLPPKFRYVQLEKDYKAMQDMIFGDSPKFDEIMGVLGELEDEINMSSK
jgi:hypothetical protein